MRLVALVPVRAGSKGLPGKNLRPLAGVPLYRRAVDQALAAGVDEVLLSTDIPELQTMEHGPAVRVIERPPELASDSVPMDPVIAHALGAVNGSARVLLLQATSPLRNVADIRAAAALHEGGGCDLAMTVTRADSGVLKWGFVEDGRFRPLSDSRFCFMNRQALPPLWRPNGAVYAFDADWFRMRDRLETDAIGAVEMPPERSWDIDSEADFMRAEAALTRK